jgi:3-methylfumaryl-CoA hydratase
MAQWDEWIGRTETRTDSTKSAQLARFQATLDSSSEGDATPQGFHWCLCTPDTPTTALGDDGHPERGSERNGDSFLPPIPQPRRMWASSQIQFCAIIPVSAAIERQTTIARITEKTGGSGTLIFVDLDHITRANGVDCVIERQTLVYRDPTTSAPEPRPADAARNLADWSFHRSLTPSQTLLFRYSALTFNSHRIHYDAPYARDEEGYRALVVHGPLTATLLLDLVARTYGHNTLKTFSFRGQSPAFVSEPLHLVGRANATQITLNALGGDGRIVMSAEGTI